MKEMITIQYLCKAIIKNKSAKLTAPMKPKEKAEELADKFMNIRNIKLSDYSIIYLPTAKQCALIAVEEMIKILNPEDWGLEINTAIDKLNYLKEVKKEIENL